MTVNEINGLPEEVGKSIPSDEKIYWVGKPNWKSFSYQAFGIKYLLIYFLICALYSVSKIEMVFSFSIFVTNYIPFLVSGLLAGAILISIAYLEAKHTVYVITERRIVIRTGVALVFLLNAPFKKIISIDRQTLSQGQGNISFRTDSRKRIPYLSCWPSVRPWSFLLPSPAFRSIPDIAAVEIIIADLAALNLENKGIKEKSGNDGVAA